MRSACSLSVPLCLGMVESISSRPTSRSSGVVAARNRFAPDYALTGRRTAGALALLLALKLPQEYLLHVDRRLDNYTLPEFLEIVGRHLR